MISRVDLHAHSTASDGRLSPTEVARLAASRGVRLLALTDHDTTAGCAEAQRQAQASGIRLIAGVEINTDSELGEAHLLGYFAGLDHSELQAALTRIQIERAKRAQAIVEKLNTLGVAITMEQVQAQANHTVIGRPHIARALVAGGWVGSPSAAFELYIGQGRRAYIPRYVFSPQEAIGLIRNAGGVAALAHPVRSGNEQHISQLVEFGLNALEVYYFDHAPDDVARLRELAKRHGLLVTGGSDFHDLPKGGGDGRRGLGSVWVPEEDGERLWERVNGLN
ncbi:MAG: PHP domain-containing protein [Chloroflexi bacterium]|nr:PHP domain-containing protein [Chloroflexota bacterium]